MSALPSPHVRNIVTSHEEPGWNYGYATSPYFEFDCARNATYLVYNGRLMPISFADSDRFEDYWALCDATPRWFPRASCRPRSGVLLSISAVWNRLCSMEDPAHEAGERIGIIGVDEEAHPAECVELPSTTERRRSREGSSPRSRRGTDPLGRRYPGTPSRRATWAQSCSKARAGALAGANAVTGIRRGPICSTSVA